MKKAMIQESPDMTFWPVTVRPPDQLALDVDEQAPYPRLQQHLVETYGGTRLQFGKLLDVDYPVGFWLEPEYRAAVKALEAEVKVEIERSRKTKTGRQPSGLQEEDVVVFRLEQMQLG
jgi:hypothetical protein